MAGASSAAGREEMVDDIVIAVLERAKPLASRLSEQEALAHEALVSKLGEKGTWAKYGSTN
jgi:DNA polymerase-3 subunit epsilon